MVSYTSWFNPDIHYGFLTPNVTLHYPISGERVLVKNTFRVDKQTKKQPHMSILKKCCIATSNYETTLWFTESCTKQFLATYVCRTRGQRSDHKAYLTQVSAHSGYDCDKGWFLLTNSSTCYILFQSNPLFSFRTAVDACSFLNSSVLKVNTDRFVPRIEMKQSIMLERLTSWLEWSYQLKNDMSPSNLIKMIVGEAVRPDILSRPLIMMRTIAQYNYIIPAYLNDKCGLVQYDRFYIGLMESATSDIMKGWGAKYRQCESHLLSTMIMCEKPSLLYNTNTACRSPYYQCDDGTCLLLIYKCDLWNDCLAGDDETGCIYSDTEDQFMLMNDTLHLPFQIHRVDQGGYGNSSMTLKIHAICDGIESDSLLVTESQVCYKRLIKHIKIADMVVRIRRRRIPDPMKRVAKQLLHIMSYRKERAYQAFNVTLLDQVEINCEQYGRFKTITDVCHINSHKEQCAFQRRSQLCQHIACPGMFKCRDYYCLLISSVCDGQIDCLNGDDEEYCSNTSCPGLLKCRGEIRCLSAEQICDGYADCVSSFDDEITCKSSCPSSCQCHGYIIQCSGLGFIGNKTDLRQLYFKGVVLIEFQHTLYLDAFSTSYMIYIDISNCDVEFILFSYKSHPIKQFILFINFSHNKLNDTSFLVIDIFQKLLVLDLGFNKISTVSNNHFHLLFLVFLDLSSNPLHTISLNLNRKPLMLLNLKHVNFIVNAWITPNQGNILAVMVSDDKFCCILPKHINCKYDLMIIKCHGIMTSLSAIIFACLMTVTTTFIIIATIKVLNDIRSNTKIYYNIVKINHIIAELILSFSLISLSAIGMSTINILWWRLSITCNLINFLFSLSLGSSMIFKTTSMCIVALKLACPFGHRFFKVEKISYLASLSWFIMPVFYGLSTIAAHYQAHSHLLLDKYCSIGDCDVDSMNRIMLVFVWSMNSVAIFTFCILLALLTLTLRKKDERIKTKIPLLKVVSHFSRQFIAQIILTVHLCLISLVKLYQNDSAIEYCLAVSTYVLPLCIVLGSILNMLM